MALIEINFDSQSDRARLYGILKNLSGRHIIQFEKARQQRSMPQNKYYWGVVVPILASEFGYYKDEMHELLRRKFLSYTRVSPHTGEEELFAKSTTKLNTQEMEVYLESIRTWALSEFSVYLPLPNEILGEWQENAGH